MTTMYPHEDVFEASHCLVDRLAAVPSVLQAILDFDGPIAIDTTTLNLGRGGKLSSLQIRTHKTYVIDIATLKEEAFDCPAQSDSDTPFTLRQFLQQKDLIKVTFDARNLSNLLFFQYGIRLGGVKELQVMEMHVRKPGRRNAHEYATLDDVFAQWQGAVKCSLTADFQETRAVLARFHHTDAEAGALAAQRLFRRPMSDMLLAHCVLDVFFYPMIYDHFAALLDEAELPGGVPRMQSQVAAGVHYETKKRLQATCRERYQPLNRFASRAEPLPPLFASPPSSMSSSISSSSSSSSQADTDLETPTCNTPRGSICLAQLGSDKNVM